MDIDLKSISYAFIANDIDVYEPDGKENCFIASLLVCKNCGVAWHPGYQQCYFCGEYNYYLYTCTGCGKMFSITKSKPKCDCNLENAELIKACMNKQCLSNTDRDIFKLTINNGGVFSRKSSFTLSQTHCSNCGNISNEYKSHFIYVMNMNIEDDKTNFKFRNNTENGSIIIYKKKKGNKILYDYEIVGKNVNNLEFKYEEFSKIVEELF